MYNKNAISVTLHYNNLQFIEQLAAKDHKSKSAIVDQVLSAYRKYKLKKDIISGFRAQTPEDEKEAMMDFGDYLQNIDKI